jgi:hypothetical protein
MKIIKYNFLSCRINHGTEEEPNYEDVILPKEIHCTADNLQANEAIAQKEAYNGEYTIEDDGQRITAPHNIMEGEYVTIDGVLYMATQNIPNGEPVIVGQNAIVTTVEAQLLELKGE